MCSPITISDRDVIEHQQSLVFGLEHVGLTRKLIAQAVGAPRNTIDKLVSGSPMALGNTRWERLRAFSISRGLRIAYERWMPNNLCIAQIPHVPFDDTTDDEVLDGAELVGRVRMDSIRSDWHAIMRYGFLLIEVGWRLVVHARAKEGRAAPTVHMGTVRPGQYELAFSGDGH